MAILHLIASAALALMLLSCNNGNKIKADMEFMAESESVAPGDVEITTPSSVFDADSAYRFLERQVEFGPRVPNTEAHHKTGDWLVGQLKKYGTKVTEQKTTIKAFDGTPLAVRNIFAQINPESSSRILLLAHWDSRPWADQDPDVSKRNQPVDGANDGASGVAVLLEIARQLQINPPSKGVDILFVDAEDWGTEGDDDSWALGTQYFVQNPPVKGYAPEEAILLDMVGGKDAVFCREYFSERYAPHVAEKIWTIAHSLGYGDTFLNKMGSAITDDHVQLIKGGIPTIDIIEYNPDNGGGFNKRWHTTSDNLDGISKVTLKKVGNTLMKYISSK